MSKPTYSFDEVMKLLVGDLPYQDFRVLFDIVIADQDFYTSGEYESIARQFTYVMLQFDKFLRKLGY